MHLVRFGVRFKFLVSGMVGCITVLRQCHAVQRRWLSTTRANEPSARGGRDQQLFDMCGVERLGV